MVTLAGGAIDIVVRPDLSDFNSTLNRGLNGALKIGASFGVAFGAATAFSEVIKLGNDFTDTMNTMQAVSSATASEMAAIGARAKELGNDVNIANTSASDAAIAMTELAKGGFTVQQSMDGAKGTLQLAAAAGIDAAAAATIQSQALQAFGLDANYAATSADVLANIANAASGEMTDFAAGLQQGGTVANAFGLSLEDTSATLGLLAKAGIQGSDAGTLLKSALLALTDQGKPAQAAIDELGLTVYDANEKFVGMRSLLDQLKIASEGMSEEQYQAATATLFGSDAMRLASVAAEQGATQFDILRAAVDKQGTAAEVAAAKSKGLPGAFAAMQNSAEALALELYDLIDGPMENFARSAADKLDGATSSIVGGFKSVASAAAPVIGVLGTVASGIASLPGPVLAASAALVLLKTTGLGSAIAGAFAATTAAAARFTTAMAAQTIAAQLAGRQMGILGAATAVAGSSVAGGFKSITAALGGPWMIAAVAAAASIYAINNALKDADESHEAMRVSTIKVAAAQRDMAKAFAASKGMVDDNVTNAVSLQLDAISEEQDTLIAKAPGFWSSIAAGAENIPGILTGEGLTGQRTLDELNGMAEGAQGVKDKLDELGITNEDLTASITGTDLAWAQMVSTMRDGTAEGQAAADEYGALRAEFEKSQEAAATLAPGFIDLAGAVDTLADKSSNADERLSALKTALDVLMGKEVPLSDAVANYNKAINDIANSAEGAIDPLQGVGKELIGLGGAVDTQTVNGGLLRDSLLSIKDASLQAALAASQDALKHGKTVPEAQDAAVAAIGRNREALLQLASDYQVPIDAIQKMIEQEGLIEKNVRSVVSLDGADAAIKSLVEVNGLISNVPPGVGLEFTIEDQVAKDNLVELGFAVEAMPNGNVKVTAPNALALDALQQVIDRTFEVGAMEATPRINADTTGFKLGADQSKTELEALDTSTADPKVGLLIDDLLAGKTVSLDAINQLDTSKATPEVILAIQNALRDADVVDKELDRIANKQRIAQISARIASGDTSFGAGFSEAFPVRKASGGRLPTTGPGTNVTDGILGVAASGMPVARVDAGEWVINGRSSDEYNRELAMINAGTFPKLPGFKTGGVVGGMTAWVDEVVPGLEMTSGLRNTDNGHHSTGNAADFSNGSGNTPEQLALAEAISEAYPDSLELIYDDPAAFAGQEIKNGQRVDSSFYDGAGDHTNHVHWAMASPPSLDRVPGAVGIAVDAPLSEREQIAKAIVDEGKRRGITPNGIRAALMTGLAESDLQNLPFGDRDSTGVFQQRDNGAWGSAEDRMDPTRAAGMFYDKLATFDYESMDAAAAAQKVQQSAFADGSNYAAERAEADAILSTLESRGAAGSSADSAEPAEVSDGKTGFDGAANSKWAEKDKLALESAIVAVRQAQEDRDAAYVNDKKTQADREQADLKVKKAEQKVRDLEAKRDTPNMVKGKKSDAPAPDAPELTTNLNDEEISLKSAELAVEKARLARNEVYAEAGVTDAEKLDADLSLQRAKNALDAERKQQAEGKTSGGSGSKSGGTQSSDPVDLLGNVAKSFVTGQMSDALGVFGLSNDMGAIGAAITAVGNLAMNGLPEVKPKGSESKSDTGGPIPGENAVRGLQALFGGQFTEEFRKATGVEEDSALVGGVFDGRNWLKKLEEGLRVPTVLRDSGGPLKNGMAALNLSGETEHVYTGKQNRDMFKELADTRAAVTNGGGAALDMREFTRQVDRLAENSSRPNVTYQTENIQAAIREETVRRTRESRSYSRR